MPPKSGGRVRHSLAGAPPATAKVEKTFVFGYRQRLEWDDLVTRVCATDDQRNANIAYHAAARWRFPAGLVVFLGLA